MTWCELDRHRPGARYTVKAEVDKIGGAKGPGEVRMRSVATAGGD